MYIHNRRQIPDIKFEEKRIKKKKLNRFSLFYMVKNNLHDDKCKRMIWGSHLNCSKFNFLPSIIKNVSIRKSDQQTKIEEYTCIYVIIGDLQALCMVYKT